MKKLIPLILGLLTAGCANAQMPIFRNQFTTNVPGAYVRGNVTFGDAATWFRVEGPFTNATGNAYFGGGVTWFADGIMVELPSTFQQGLDATGQVFVVGTVIATNVQVNPPLWDDVRISIGNLTSPSVAPGRVTVSTAGAATISAYGFDKDADEALSFELQLPHGINTNNAYGIHCHIHYTGLTAPSATSNIVWGLTYMAASPTRRFNTVPLTIYATNGLTGTTNHMLAEFPAITNLVESAIIFGTIFRDADNLSDEYPADAIALSFDAHYPRRQMGSHGEYGDF